MEDDGMPFFPWIFNTKAYQSQILQHKQQSTHMTLWKIKPVRGAVWIWRERESQSEGIWVCSCKSWIVTMHSHGTVWSLVVGFKHILNSRLGLSFQRGDIKHKPHEPEIKSHCQCCMTLLKPSSWFLLHSRSIIRVHRASSWPFWHSNVSSDSKMKQGPCSFQSLENLMNAVSKYVKVAVVAHHLWYVPCRPSFVPQLQFPIISQQQQPSIKAPSPISSRSFNMARSLCKMALSENSVPLHPMVNDHYPY